MKVTVFQRFRWQHFEKYFIGKYVSIFTSNVTGTQLIEIEIDSNNHKWYVLVIRTVNMFISFCITLKEHEKIISYLCIIREYI